MQNLGTAVKALLKKPTQENELDNIVQLLRRTNLFSQFSKLCQTYEIKDLIRDAKLITKETGEIISEHYTQSNLLYIIAEGIGWVALKEKEKDKEQRFLKECQPQWWYLEDINRLHTDLKLMVMQVWTHQGRQIAQEWKNVIPSRGTTPRKSSMLASVFKKIESKNLALHPGDIIPTRYSELEHDKQYDDVSNYPSVVIRQRMTLIQIDHNCWRLFVQKILTRFKQMEQEYLMNLYFFQELNRREVAQVYSHSQYISLRKGKLLYRKGDLIKDIYIIRDGEVQIQGEQPISIIGVDQIAGETDVVFGLNHRESSAIVTSTKCTVLKISVDEYRRLINHMDAVEQSIVLQSQGKFATKKSEFRHQKHQTTENLINNFVLPQYSVKRDIDEEVQQLFKRLTPKAQSLSNSITLFSKPRSKTPFLREALMDFKYQIMDSPCGSRPKSVSSRGRTKSKSRKPDLSLSIRIDNPLLNGLQLQNEKLNQINTVKGFYNKMSKQIFSRFQSQKRPQTGYTQYVNDTTINEPPQVMRKAIEYLRQRNGIMDDTSPLIKDITPFDH